MPKRKRNGPITPGVTAGPVNESTGQRSVFPQLVSARETDFEWQYGQDPEGLANGDDEQFLEDVDGDVDVNGEYQYDDAMGDAVRDGEYQYEEEEEENEGEEEEQTDGDDGEWDVEPQTEAIAYLFQVRTEAETLPAMTYLPPQPTSGPDTSPSKTPQQSKLPSNEANLWETQFLSYYTSLRKTISTHPQPTLTQPELDTLLHINPRSRPTTSTQEDALWRLKTLDPPSLTLLAMLDHQRIIHLLTHLRKKMSANVKKEQCMWLVFLLAALGDLGVLNGDEVDLLRRIAKKCGTVRLGMGGEGDDVVLVTVKMVLCIIRRFYGQSDLEDVIPESTG